MILAAATIENSADLWHCRMGHVNWSVLKHLTKVATDISISPRMQAGAISKLGCKTNKAKISF